MRPTASMSMGSAHCSYRRSELTQRIATSCVTVADQAADASGLWLADYDLLARMPGLERLDLIATENVLAAGFHERVHDVLPGIEEERWGGAAAVPVIAAPESAAADPPLWSVSRDREEELAAVARSIKRGAPRDLERTAVVFQRPLPYLYLARQVFPDAEIPYQALDSLPLAAEPFAAALDLVLSFVRTEATRGALIELLRCSHWSFGPAGSALSPADIAAADGLLRDVKYVGGWDRLLSLAAEAGQSSRSNTDRTRSSTWTRAAPALAAAASAATELRGLADAPLASAQLAALRAFITAHERLPSPADERGTDGIYVRAPPSCPRSNR